MAAEARPTVTAGVLGDVLGVLPARLRRRLDAEPMLAEGWTWSAVDGVTTVEADEATVTLRPTRGVIGAADQVACTCLLAPRCLHLAAVLSRLEPVATIGGDAATDAALDAAWAAPAVSPAAPAADVALPKPPAGRAARRRSKDEAAATRAAVGLATAVARLLDLGATSAGVVVTGEILRAVHTCQVLGLHRAAAAGLRVAQGLARLRADEPEFRLAELRNDIAEVLAVTRRLAGGEDDASTIGVARRAYEPVGGLRLYGLCSEPIVARSGYAGCVTTFVDATGSLWALSDVQPGDAERARYAYLSPLGLGDVALSHQAAVRAGVHLGEARASADGRLGRGQQVRAVRASGVAWTEPPVDPLFRVPLAEQLARAWESLDRPETERRHGSTMLFLDGWVLGGVEGRLGFAVDGTPLLVVAPIDHDELSFQEGLVTLASVPGAHVRLVARALFDRPGTVEAVAVGSPEGEGLALPEALGGRLDLGFERLPRSALGAEPPPAVTPRHRTPDVLDPLMRRLDRLVIGGRSTLGEPSRRGVERDLIVLRRRHFPTGAAVLDALSSTAIGRTDQAQLAERWLAAVTYARVAHRRVAAARWLGE